MVKTRSGERGTAIVLSLLLVLALTAISGSLILASATHHVHALQVADGARARAVAEGEAALVLAELGEDNLAPVRNSGSYAVEGNAYVRTREPFEQGEGRARVELTYLRPGTSGNWEPVLFKERDDPVETFKRVRLLVEGFRPRAARTVEVVLEEQFILFDGAIISDAMPTSGSGSGKSLAQAGHIVFESKGRSSQFFVDGSLMSNGGAFYDSSATPLSTGTTNKYFMFSGTVTQGLAGGPEEIPDFTQIGSARQLFDFERFIAAARAGAGREFASLAAFVQAMDQANAGGQPLEGIIVLSLDPAEFGGKQPHIKADGGGKQGDLLLKSGINIRGTLLFNFAPGTDPYWKVFIECPLRINAADVSAIDPTQPATWTSGYAQEWVDASKRPHAVKIAPAYEDFTPEDDIPALMFNTGIVDIHGAANISGLVYGPSFVEIENKKGTLQYFDGAILGGAGVLVQGNKDGGMTVVRFNRATINRLATDAGKGLGLKVLAWRTSR